MSKWRRGGLSSVYAKKKDNGFAVFLNDKPKKYKYKPYPMILECVLFLIDI
jgi:hypothetical protein